MVGRGPCLLSSPGLAGLECCAGWVVLLQLSATLWVWPILSGSICIQCGLQGSQPPRVIARNPVSCPWDAWCRALTVQLARTAALTLGPSQVLHTACCAGCGCGGMAGGCEQRGEAARQHPRNYRETMVVL